jgi:hypothetical protein
VLTSGKEDVVISFQSRFFGGKLPSELIFAKSMLKIQLSSLAYGVVCINKLLTCITNDTLTSKYECVFHMCAFDLNTPRRLANCKADISFCNKNPLINIFPAEVLFCTKRSHNRSRNNQCHCKLCVKTGPASLKSLCVNKLWRLPSKYHKQKLCVRKTNYVYSKHRSNLICVSTQAKINLKCKYFVKLCLFTLITRNRFLKNRWLKPLDSKLESFNYQSQILSLQPTLYSVV